MDSRISEISKSEYNVNCKINIRKSRCSKEHKCLIPFKFNGISDLNTKTHLKAQALSGMPDAYFFCFKRS